MTKVSEGEGNEATTIKQSEAFEAAAGSIGIKVRAANVNPCARILHSLSLCV